jgi:hypothetical protein
MTELIHAKVDHVKEADEQIQLLNRPKDTATKQDVINKGDKSKDQELKKKRHPGKYSTDELVDKYVWAVIKSQAKSPSQDRLEQLTGIDQSTWSRFFKEQKNVKKVRDKLDAMIDMRDALVEVLIKIDSKLETLKSRSDEMKTFESKEVTFEEIIDSEQSVPPSTKFEKEHDAKVIEKMNRREMIKEILLNKPVIKEEKLNGYSDDELRKIMKQIVRDS